MKFCIGPVTKNTVDVVIDLVNTYSYDIIFIPSRRQIDYNGGYVNNWTTSEFYNYIQNKSNKKIKIERDHGGPGQGKSDDDGFISLEEDCKYMDIIHIDPWKKYPDLKDGIKKTVEILEYCYSKNPNLYFEIGTEQGIRPFSTEEIEYFVESIKKSVSTQIFQRIQYLVIQCGTQLLEQQNIGIYDSEKLHNMLKISKKYDLISKEHNGDWITDKIIQQKAKQGLTVINIAPEFGSIESSVILRAMKKNPLHFEELYNICFESNTWKKWVSPDFIPEQNKEKLIIICGHYILHNSRFLELKQYYPEIDKEIKNEIFQRLYSLCNLKNE